MKRRLLSGTAAVALRPVVPWPCVDRIVIWGYEGYRNITPWRAD